jgi:VanZ family protein
MAKPDRARIWQLALAAYWLALLVATHLPREFPVLPPDRTDKLVHVAAFAVLGWLVAETWQRSAGRLNAAHLRAAWLAIALYAPADELTQPLFGRAASLADWLADAAGAALGLWLFAIWQRPHLEAGGTP